jgi:hypothetical protein
MAKLFGSLTYNDSDYIFNQTSGQEIVWQATMDVVTRHNQDLQSVIDLFVETTTTNYSERYLLPGFGTLQELGQMSRPKAVKSGGSWDVAYPLRKYGDQIAWDKETMAYMTMERYRNHVQTIMNDDVATVRILILQALTGGVAVSYVDPFHGTLSVKPLANNDGTLYPGVIGSNTEAQQNGYLVTGYAASSISDTNDPIATAVNYLESLHGTPTGGSNIWTFINNAQSAKIRALTDFTPVEDYGVRFGDDTTKLVNIPTIPPGMRLLGRASGSWIIEWRRLPANYMLHVHGDISKPLKMRVHPEGTGLPGGLNLEAREEEYPFQDHIYIRRCGFGVGNRLSGAVTFLDAGASYVAPTIV